MTLWLWLDVSVWLDASMAIADVWLDACYRYGLTFQLWLWLEAYHGNGLSLAMAIADAWYGLTFRLWLW